MEVFANFIFWIVVLACGVLAALPVIWVIGLIVIRPTIWVWELIFPPKHIFTDDDLPL